MRAEQLTQSLNSIQLELDRPVEISSPVDILEKLETLTRLLGLSSECYAWSEKYYNEKLGELVKDLRYISYTATDKKMLFASEASFEIKTLSHAERLNKGLSHSIDGLRSMLSYLKEEYRQTQS